MAQTLIKPQVDLTFSDITAEALRQVDQRRLGSPKEVIEGALMSYRMMVITHVKNQIMDTKRLTAARLLQLVDQASRLYLGRFNRLLGPSVANAYIRAFRAANAGDVPLSTIYALAEQHTDRIGTYYAETSKEALVQGFNTFVNQRMPVRAAADKALDGYGLTPRQMSGYTSAKVAGKVSSAQQLTTKGKVLDYITRSLRDRFSLFAEQESHNLDQQATQTAWMWLQNKGAISEVAQKVWLTAHDERVCPECGPMHGKKVGVTEKFKLPSGAEYFVPGVHPRCRCEARLVDPLRLVRKDLLGADLNEFNREHPRDKSGRFSAKARAQGILQQRADQAQTRFRPVGHTDRPSPELERLVEEAEALRAKTPVIEPTQTLAPAQTLSSPQSLRPIQRLRAEQTLRPVSARQVLGATKQEITSQRLAMPTQLRQKLGEDMRQLFNELAQTAPGPTKRPKVYRLPVVDIVDENGARINVYALGSVEEIDQHGRLTLTHDKVFSPDLLYVQSQAVARLERLHEDARDRIADAYEDRYIGTEGAHAEVSEDDVWAVIGYISAQASGDPARDLEVEVQWYDGDGERFEGTPLRYSDLAEEWGLDPEDFAINIYRMSTGHDSSLGRTYNQQTGTRHGEEIWHTSGDYNTMKSPNEALRNTAFSMYDIEPDVELEYLEDDWNV